MELLETIRSLTDVYGVSGDEFGVSAVAAELLIEVFGVDAVVNAGSGGDR